jgi:PKD repeat protein
MTTSNFGCKDSITKPITIYPNPNVAFTSDVIYGAPPLTINFDNTSSAGVYTWDFGDGSSTSSLMNPSHVFNDTGTYQVALYVTSQYGCIDSAQLVINVFEPIVDISVINNSITRQGNQWLMKALFKNNGNLTINDVDVKLNLQGKSVLYERITSLNLLPGSFIEYRFKSSFDANDVTPSYFCVEATAVDNFDDRNSENNTFCSTIKNEFECYNLYPNPASDYISFGLTIPEDGLVEVNLYNEIGVDCIQMKSEYYAKGYSNVILNFNQATMISSASYFIKVRYKESFRTLKFIKH